MVVDAPAVLPTSGGAYRLVGLVPHDLDQTRSDLELCVTAVYAIDRAGAAECHNLTIADVLPGDVQISLSWDADSDVDLEVLGPDGAFAGMTRGAVFVDHTTASAVVARELHATAGEHGFGFVDAPVSGGQAGAENGVLAVMCGGDEETFERVRPVMDCYSKVCSLIGPPGAGQLTKMVNQICIAGVVQGLSEATNFAVRSGLDSAKVLDVISQGAAGSWQMQNRMPTMVKDEFEFGFAVDWMRKDLGMCLAEGDRNGARLPLTALVDQFYAEVQAMGGGRWDTSSLMRLLTRT